MKQKKSKVVYQTAFLTPEERDVIGLYARMNLKELDGKHHAPKNLTKAKSHKSLKPAQPPCITQSLTRLDTLRAENSLRIVSARSPCRETRRSTTPLVELPEQQAK